jgi:hypothetical protein
MKADVIIPVASLSTQAGDHCHKADPDRDGLGGPGAGGYVTNLLHPGGNITGVAGETAAKRLQLLRDTRDLPRWRELAGRSSHLA